MQQIKTIKNERIEEQRNELENEWKEMIAQYNDPLGIAEYQDKDINFESLVEEAQ